MSDQTGINASSLEALAHQYRVLTNNLANANTAGFKRTRTGFRQLLEAAAARAVTPGDSGTAGRTVRAADAIDFQQGVLTHTGRSLDLALEGEGFFVLETPDGPLYTRGGTFRANPAGQLVDSQNRLVGGRSGPIVVPSSVPVPNVRVSRDGLVSAAGETIGQLRIVRFADLSALQPAGVGAFRAADGASPQEARDVAVHQGYHESSNVSVVEEMVSLIAVTRLYEANLKTVKVQDQRLENLLRVAAG